MKFKTNVKGCRLFVKVKTSSNERIDIDEINRFSRLRLRGFLKPEVIKKNVVLYTGPISVSLFERLKRPVSKKEFLFIVEQIVVAVQKLQSNNFAINGLITNLKNAYINEVTKEVQLLYIPAVSEMQNMNLVDFFETVAYSIKPIDEKDVEYVSRFIYYFKSIKPFDVAKVELFVNEEDRSVVDTIRKQNPTQSGFMTNKQRDYYEHYQNNGSDPTGLLNEGNDEKIGCFDTHGVDDPTGLLNEGNDEKTGRFDTYGVDDPTGLLNEGNDEKIGRFDTYGVDDPTGLLNEGDGENIARFDTYGVDDPTGLLNECDEKNISSLTEKSVSNAVDGYGVVAVHSVESNSDLCFPCLFRVLTEENIVVNKPVFRLGKEKSYVDYFVSNNNAVSRGHADIITRGNRFFIKDLNSKNHTYVNGERLAVNIEFELCDQDHFKLGNEEFIFNLK